MWLAEARTRVVQTFWHESKSIIILKNRKQRQRRGNCLKSVLNFKIEGARTRHFTGCDSLRSHTGNCRCSGDETKSATNTQDRKRRQRRGNCLKSVRNFKIAGARTKHSTGCDSLRSHTGNCRCSGTRARVL